MEIPYADVLELCRKAGDSIAVQKETMHIARKSDNSPVTQADTSSNDILLQGLSPFGIPVISEESPELFAEHREGFVWIVDPLDGTSAFIAGAAEWSVMIALVEHGEPIFAVVYAPKLGTLWRAQKGRGAFRETKNNVEKISVSTVSDPHEATILLSQHHFSKQCGAVASLLGAKSVQLPGLGVKVCRVAEGAADLYWSEATLGEWDTSAPQLILQEAGGTMTSAAGEPLQYGFADPKQIQGVAASNRLLHTVLVEAEKALSQPSGAPLPS